MLNISPYSHSNFNIALRVSLTFKTLLSRSNLYGKNTWKYVRLRCIYKSKNSIAITCGDIEMPEHGVDQQFPIAKSRLTQIPD